MTTEQPRAELNRLMAECEGWQDCHVTAGLPCGVPPGLTVKDEEYRQVPNYCGSLDTVAAVEARLSEKEELRYLMNLVKEMQEPGTNGWRTTRTYRAAAPQRVIALLRLKGKGPEVDGILNGKEAGND